METAMSERPNILFLMTDQHRHDAIGCADPVVKTPNLDALAARGIRYTQAACQVPMCVASRYSMMTGLYGSQSGLKHNTQIVLRDELLPLPVLAQRLRAVGYQTAGFGKTHWWEDQTGVPWEPTTRDFEIRACNGRPGHMYYEPGMAVWEDDPAMARAVELMEEERRAHGRGGSSISGYLGQTSALSADEHHEGWFTRQAIDFLEGGRDSSRPFFCYLSFNYPHCSHNVPPGYEELYDIAEIEELPLPPWGTDCPYDEHVAPDNRAAGWKALDPATRKRAVLRYYALCSYVDDCFGKAIATLRRTGELENTLILWCSDHGEMLANRGHRFAKFCLYEDSIRVPLIIAGAGVPAGKGGTVDDRPAELVDILPTLLEAAGAAIPPELPGGDLLAAPCRLGTFTEMHGKGYEQVQAAPAYAWRTKDWKLILWLDGDVPGALLRTDQVKGNLFHLAEDPHEWHDLYHAPEHFTRREAMTRQLLMHLAVSLAKFPFQAAKPVTELGPGPKLILPRIPTAASAEALAPNKRWTTATIAPAGHLLATVRLAVAGAALAIDFDITEHRLAQADNPWEASSLELFAAPPDAPAETKAQLIIAPPAGGRPVRILRATARGLVDESTVSVAFETGTGRYRLRLLVPFATLGLPDDADAFAFAFDLSVTAAPGADAPYVRAYLASRANPVHFTEGYARVAITNDPNKGR
jgi:arylsulfatase A-like enzyme